MKLYIALILQNKVNLAKNLKFYRSLQKAKTRSIKFLHIHALSYFKSEKNIGATYLILPLKPLIEKLEDIFSLRPEQLNNQLRSPIVVF